MKVFILKDDVFDIYVIQFVHNSSFLSGGLNIAQAEKKSTLACETARKYPRRIPRVVLEKKEYQECKLKIAQNGRVVKQEVSP